LTYESNVQGGYVLEDNSASSSLSSITYRYGNTGNINSNNDRIAVTSSGGTNNILSVSMSNGSGGDYIRVIVKPSTNSAPTASNSTVYINENNQVSSAGDRTPSNITKVFTAGDFNYSDGDSDSLSKIKITTLESAGTLEYSSNGSSWADVTLNQEISATDISNNRLRFTPVANSESNPTFGFKVHDGTDYSSSPYTMTVSVNAAPNVTDATVGSTVAAGGTSSGDVHDGVVDSDDNDSVLVVTGVASGNESSNNTIITNNTGVGSAVSGTYGSLNIAANGTYTYTASSTNNIAYDATATDIFTFTTRDDESNSGSNAYDVGSITFTVASSISLTDDTDSVNEDATITKTGSQDDVLNDDAADTNGLVVTHIKKDGGSNSTVASSSTYTSNGTSVTGTYGTLVIGADGSYTYTADLSAADDLDLNDEVTDVFVYTADGATANLTITVTGINDVPEAADKTVTTNEDTAYVFSASDFGYTDADDHDALVSVKITGLEDAGALQYNNGSAWVDVTENQVITATDIAANKLRFNPTANENGSSYTSFDFTVNDGDADSASANTITVNVTAVNDAPTARDDTGIVNEDATLTVSNSSDATTSVTAASFVRSKSLGDAGYQSQETKFSPDGTKMFVLDTYQNTNEIHQYTLTTAFDISSASFDGADETFDLSNENSSSSNFTFNNDGTKFYSAYSGRLYEYDVSTAYDISTSSYNNNFFDLILEYPNTRNMGSGVNVAFNSDGTKLFALDAQQREVHEYSLSTAFDVTSASRTNNYVSVGTQEASPYGFAFSNDGKKMFISGLGADVNEYTLSTGFDLSSTFEFVGSFDVSSKDSYPLGITFNNDGTKMFVTGSQQDKLFEYSLTSPFSLIDVSGEHSGDVINTSSTDNYDTDPEGDSLTVTTYSHTSATDQDGGSISSTSSTGTAGTNNVTGYYGTLDLEGNGSYTYTADLTVTQALDAGDAVTDIFTYTVDDGNGGTDTATITITVIGMNDTPVAQNDVGVIVEDGTLKLQSVLMPMLQGLMMQQVNILVM
jgi:VCBS repeat-containing protein